MPYHDLRGPEEGRLSLVHQPECWRGEEIADDRPGAQRPRPARTSRAPATMERIFAPASHRRIAEKPQSAVTALYRRVQTLRVKFTAPAGCPSARHS